MRRLLPGLVLVAFTTPPAAADPPRDGPRPVAPQFAGVGRLAPDLALTDSAGKPVRLSAVLKDRKAVVVAVTSTTCPVSKRYLPALAALERDLGPKGVGFVFLDAIATDTPESIAAAAAAHKLAGPVAHDKDGAACKALGARTTADVFLLDAERTVVYRGAIDDRYGVGYSRDTPTRTYLADAVAAVLAGRPVAVPATEAPGCLLDLDDAPAPPPTPVTYHARVSRIVQAHCLECHRDGGVGPFPLATAADLLAHKGMVRKVVDAGTMPPWFAGPPTSGEGHAWANDRSLTAADKADLLAWLAAGGPDGDPADAPAPRTFPADWAIGTPDLVVQIPEPIKVKAEGTMPYQHAVAETKLADDTWIQAVEVKPTARAVVHHVLVFVAADDKLPAKERARLDAEAAGGFFAAYVPGNDHQTFPAGFAKKLPKGAKLRFQIHYTPNGTAAEDQVKVGLVFAKEPPRYELKVVGIANNRIRIPPGAADHPETAAIPVVPWDAVITSFMPHLHVRGKACRYELTTGGKTTTLLDVPRYDFNWQLRYEAADPVVVPRGSKLTFTARFDNSDKNPANPDPTATVRWGPQTSDEMLLGYIEYYRPTP